MKWIAYGWMAYAYFLPSHNTQFETVASSVYHIWHDAKVQEAEDLRTYLEKISKHMENAEEASSI